MDEKLVSVNISIDFCIINEDNTKNIRREFESLSEDNNDPISRWAKLARSRGDMSESEGILLSLIIELHRKIDKLEQLIEQKQDTHISLEFNNKISQIGHEYFQLQDNVIENKKLYGRLQMPVFPKRQIPIYFSHHKEDIYKIDFMHNRDTVDYDSYIKARERALIRESRGYNE